MCSRERLCVSSPNACSVSASAAGISPAARALSSAAAALARGDEEFPAVLLHDGRKTDLLLYLKNTNAEERELLLRGCLINYYAAKAVN